MIDQKMNIIIADDNKEFCDVLNNYLLNQKDINVIGIARNGMDAIKLIKEKKPDLVVLDMIMPILDGLGVLEKLNTMVINPKPCIIVSSAVGNDKIIERAMSLGVAYYIVKPFNMDTLVEKIRQMLKNNKYNDTVKKSSTYFDNIFNISKPPQIDMLVQITNIIHQIGITPNLKGYIYLREAIFIVINDNKLLSTITKDLYRIIGEQFNTTASRVERSMRNAINISWGKNQVENINKIFGYTISNKKGKPSNSEFIAMVTDKLRLHNRIS